MKTGPTEALRLIEYSWYALPNATAIDRKDCIEAVNIAFKEGQSSPKIKQLEWDFYGTYYSAETSVIDYMITQENDFVENDGDCALWVNGFPISHSTLEEVKSAAQRDFEKRIKECLL